MTQEPSAFPTHEDVYLKILNKFDIYNYEADYRDKFHLETPQATG